MMQSPCVPVEVLTQVACHFLTFREIGVTRIVCTATNTSKVRLQQLSLLARKQGLFHTRMSLSLKLAAYFHSRALLQQGHRDRYMRMRLRLAAVNQYRDYSIGYLMQRSALLHFDSEDIGLLSAEASREFRRLIA